MKVIIHKFIFCKKIALLLESKDLMNIKSKQIQPNVIRKVPSGKKFQRSQNAKVQSVKWEQRAKSVRGSTQSHIAVL